MSTALGSCRYADVARVLLLEGKASCDARNTHNGVAGFTALCVAAEMCNVGVTKVLLMYGGASSARVRTSDGRTPLHWAALATPPEHSDHFGPILSREGVVRALLEVPGIDAMVRRGVAWRGVASCGVVWCGVAWRGGGDKRTDKRANARLTGVVGGSLVSSPVLLLETWFRVLAAVPW